MKLETRRNQRYKIVGAEEDKSAFVKVDNSITPLINDLIKDYISGNVVSFDKNAQNADKSSRTEVTAEAIEAFMTAHSIRKMKKDEYIKMAQVLLNTIDTL